MKPVSFFALCLTVVVAACGAGGGDPTDPGDTPPATGTPGNGGQTGSDGSGGAASALDQTLRAQIRFKGMEADPTTGRNLPSVSDPLVLLGKQLFFTKGLSGDLDTACASCHHPLLGGGDGLSLPVGSGATNPDVLGPGRTHQTGMPRIGRNAASVLNVALKDSDLFWDGRLQSLAATPVPNGADAPIRTPDAEFGIADPDAGQNLTAAQARFPVTLEFEMRGNTFEAGADGQAVRDHLAARLGNYGEGAGELVTNQWLPIFQAAYGSTAGAADLITFANIARALGEYQRSLVFVNSPWRAYVEGENSAISESAKRGAIAFLATPIQGGGGCALCHTGSQFTDQGMHLIAVPQIGPGKGDGDNGTQDFGRGRESGQANDRFRFRTPGLLNVEVTGPWMHDGAYASLEDAIRHYSNTEAGVAAYVQNAQWCDLPQFSAMANCAGLFADASDNQQAIAAQLTNLRAQQDSLLPVVSLSETQIADIAAFLRSLTDPCLRDKGCLSPWLPAPGDGGPDGLQLNAVTINGDPY